MTTVRFLNRSDKRRLQVYGKLRLAALVCLASVTPAFGQDRPVHWPHAGAMPPGAIGRQRLLRGGPLSGYSQPVLVRAPQGALIAPAAGEAFGLPHRDRLLVGLQIGLVYRFRVTEIPEHPGVEVFPTVEMIDRLYPPPGQAARFPVPVDLTLDELLMAADGKFVTRVIYVEDPQLALDTPPDAEGKTPWVEARVGDNPLTAADALGRPIAILRMGSRVPDPGQSDVAFLYGAPQMAVFDSTVVDIEASPTYPPAGAELAPYYQPTP
ncbi:MAG: hypothetical protein AAF961_00945 [Planctomycetota bacterium]